MIARRWSGTVLREHAPEYLELMRSVAIPDYRSVEGNVGALCLHAARGQVVEITMLTFWRDMAAITSFAGAEPQLAKYYDFDDKFLLWKAREVEHAEIDPASVSEAIASKVGQS